MDYRAVNGRCAADIADLRLPLSEDEALALLGHLGFDLVEVDPVEIARSRVGVSTYRRGARMREAPRVFDCSGFAKWVYGACGIWLPRRSIQQRECGIAIPVLEIEAGDVVFVSGRIDYYFDDPEDGVGHVGIATSEGTVVHAANTARGVVEDPFEDFAPPGKLRGIRRYRAPGTRVFAIPPDREVETSDDLRWIALQNL